MKFYLGNIGETPQEIFVEVLPEITCTKDESLASAIFVLKATLDPTPIKPNTRLIVDMETTPNKKFIFVVESDSIEVVSTSNPLKYKHTLTAVQNIKLLKKYLIRNSSLSASPRTDGENGYFAKASVVDPDHSGQEGSLTYKTMVSYGGSWQNPIKLKLNDINPRSKIFINFNLEVFGYKLDYDYAQQQREWSSEHGDFTTLNELNILCSYGPGFTQSNLRVPFEEDTSMTIKAYDEEGIATTYVKQLVDLGIEIPIKLNKNYRVPFIEQLIKDGAKSIEIEYKIMKTPVQVYWEGTNEGVVEDHVTPHFVSEQIKIKADSNAYNCYEILELLLSRSVKKTEEIEYDTYDYPFLLPDSNHNPELYDLLINTDAPNFVFTQATLFECVAEVFRLFDAMFTIDENNYIDIDYLNEKKREIVLDGQITSIHQSLSSGIYTNGIVAYYQDARTLEVFPSKKGYARQRSSDLGVAAEDDHYIITPHRIDTVKSVKIYIDSVTILVANEQINYLSFMSLDVTRWVIESTIWSQLSLQKGFVSNYTDVVQNNSLPYSKGSNRISIANQYNTSWGMEERNIYNTITCATNVRLGLLSGSPRINPTIQIEDSWFNVQYNVEYYTTLNGKVRVDSLAYKDIGETLVDQNNGGVDLNRLGSNMLGVSMKTGEPKKTVTIKLRNWADRIEEGSYTSDGYVANIVSYTFLNNNVIQERIEFVKNYNALSQRVQLLKEKRLSAISSELTVKSEEIITEYVKVSYANYATEYANSFAGNLEDIMKCIQGTFIESEMSIDMVSITNGPIVEDYGSSASVYIPLVKYGAGNCVCFEMSYDHPISAGNRSSYEVAESWYGDDKYFTRSVNYTDPKGKISTMDINFFKVKEGLSFDNEFPILDGYITPDYSLVGRIGYFEVNKQPNEIFALNFEICFLSDDMFIGSEFINHNGLIERLNNKKFKFYSSETSKYDILDKKVLDDGLISNITNVTYSWEQGDLKKFQLKFQLTNTLTPEIKENMKSWAIGDEDGNIYLACNNEPTTNNNILSVFFSYQGRLKR